MTDSAPTVLAPPDPAEPDAPFARWLSLLIPIAAFLVLFADPILRDVNFVYRDAGHFYYPLFQMQMDEWRAGRIPLWNPYENGGEPLAANPTSSVFYPGKILFLAPFPIAFKLYHLLHVAWAMVTAGWAARAFGASRPGAALAAIAYGLGGFVLFQLYNVIYLVSAAWLPVAIVACDRIAQRPDSLASAVGLSASLAMMILGGDPQTAQLALVAGFLYVLAANLSWRRSGLLMLIAAGLGSAVVEFSPALRQGVSTLWRTRSIADAWLASHAETHSESAGLALVGIVSILGVVGTRRWWSAGNLGRSLRTLAVATLLTVGLSAVQVLPTAEFAARTTRASPDVPQETVAFSLHPARLAECVVGSAYGRMLPQNTRWFPWAKQERQVWVPTLYFGFLPLVLALRALTYRRAPGVVIWLGAIVIVSLWLSLGKFGGVRWLYDDRQTAIVDPLELERGDRLFGDSDGLYWFAEKTIPGFEQFRYPSKCLIFAAFGLAILAARAMTDLARTIRWQFVSLAGLLGVGVPIGLHILLRGVDPASVRANSFGPYLSTSAASLLTVSTVATLTLTMLAIAAAWRWRVRPGENTLSFILLFATAVDVTFANRWLVLTDDQGSIDTRPEVIKVITDHARKAGIHEPFRIHRTRLYEPDIFRTTSNPDRVAQMSRWERTTAQPKYGLPAGIMYTKTEGTMNLYDIDFFTAPWVVPTPPALRAKDPRQPEQMVYYPRQGYNLWNSRYFVLPKGLLLHHVERGDFTLRFDRDGRPLPVLKEWSVDTDDCIVLENTEAMPRAWIVHEIDWYPEIHDMRRDERSARLERLLYRSRDGGLPLWIGGTGQDYPINTRAFVETDDPSIKETFDAGLGLPADTTEFARVTRYLSDRVELDVSAARTGLLVLADAFYPGWQATLDGEPVPILRANRAMRGILLPPGTHTVTFQYRSMSFEAGAAISLAALVLSGLILGRSLRRAT